MNMDISPQLRRELPSMYDLPSENPEEPGLPDMFHDDQPDLLTETFRPPGYPPERMCLASDLNLYYDPTHTHWYKRPDWYAVLGVPRLYEERDLRLSYVHWQEGVSPYLVVELLSPGTEKEDLGQTTPRGLDSPPSKWEVYERILGVPYYAVYSRYNWELQVFALEQGRYRRREVRDGRFWLPEVKLGLGLWQGVYRGLELAWLRFYTESGEWIATADEKYAREKQRAEQERQRAEQEKQHALQETQRAEQERQRAEQEKQHALQETQRAEQERQHALQETQRAEQERQHALQETQRAEQERQHALQEKQRADKLAARLRELGLDPDTL